MKLSVNLNRKITDYLFSTSSLWCVFDSHFLLIFFVSDAFSIIKEYSTNYSIDICCRCNSKVKEKIPEKIPKKMFQLLLSLANTCWQKQMLIIFDKYCNNTYCFALKSHLNHSYVQVPLPIRVGYVHGKLGLTNTKTNNVGTNYVKTLSIWGCPLFNNQNGMFQGPESWWQSQFCDNLDITKSGV